jgi:hypothetical protein
VSEADDEQYQITQHTDMFQPKPIYEELETETFDNNEFKIRQ